MYEERVAYVCVHIELSSALVLALVLALNDMIQANDDTQTDATSRSKDATERFQGLIQLHKHRSETSTA
jgi:hypothetical protein